MLDQYAVIGNPIAHSLSPRIHATFAHQTHQALEYGAILGNLDDFAGDVRGFIAMGGRGLNVTVPFKEQAWQLLADRSPRAELAGAINTLIIHDDGRLHGDNTDGIGFMRDLIDNHGFQFTNRRVLLLGAGGAARGLVPALLTSDLAHLTVANRTVARAQQLAETHAAVDACALTELTALQPFDLIINATSSGLTDQHLPSLPAHCLAAGGWVYDLIYRPAHLPATPFCRWGTAHGAARVLDGLGMLVEQAAEAFWLWRGVRPNTAPVIAALRDQNDAV
ncbi:shikimate dehydrogenase [Thiospirillum jenense]|uniref:Shikimate dehydrogenase (NADP(+)) n=1 Tax=Thiospirillum jenense TaxID=1653858 RepID=A0A839HP33_9GAMM|nr:shikimate dehydrogenase [Thiospirillum jenense]MBB1127032.1 shikimate dehydrogenase [Thiospirillum jenense]